MSHGALVPQWEKESRMIPAEKRWEDKKVQEKADNNALANCMRHGGSMGINTWFNRQEQNGDRRQHRLYDININQIFLEDGVHDEQGEYVVIDFPVTIIGESKDGCTIIGGLNVKGKKEDDVNVN